MIEYRCSRLDIVVAQCATNSFHIVTAVLSFFFNGAAHDHDDHDHDHDDLEIVFS